MEKIPNTGLEHALQLDRWGFNVLPARGKAPTVDWREYQEERTTSKLPTWFRRGQQLNYWIATGRISRVVVLDCDNQAAEDYWREQLGDDVLDSTPCVRTRKGHHYYFRIEADDPITSWAKHPRGDDDEPSFDVRGAGGGVIVPPSIHETGHVYEWVRDPSTGFQDLPEALRSPFSGDDEAGGAPARSMLSALLESPPAEGGRNVWMASVAGHYAKMYRDLPDLYETQCGIANDLLDPPLDDDELEKTIESIWRKEHRKSDEQVAVWQESSGWLIDGGDCLLTRVKRGEEYVLEPWSNFGIQAVGVMEDDNETTYDVLLKRRDQGDEVTAQLSSSILSDTRRLSAWCARYRCAIYPPDSPRLGSVGSRLLRYLESQKPDRFRVVQTLGWHEDGFVCHEGVITWEGMVPHEGVRPAPILRNWAPYYYGMEDGVRVLAEVLTYHDPTVCAVFGAWWMACLVKPQISEVVSLFPFMALEAPSESGKTTGFFSLMVQLAGNTQGQTNPTKAALRDQIAAHQSGIVWIDDLDDVDNLMELLRQATGGGTVGKKGEDRHTQEMVKLVAPIVLSGETINLDGQKALIDRAVRLSVPSPTKRRSLHDPDRMQWDDILQLKQEYPDLTIFAGSMVQVALCVIPDDLPAAIAEHRDGAGRYADKMAVLKIGARMLSDLLDDEQYFDRVVQWCTNQVDVGAENALTLKLLPRALALHNFPNGAAPAQDGRVAATPAFIKDGRVWFSVSNLAHWWAQSNHGRISQRTESEGALRQQAQALPTVRSHKPIGATRISYYGLDEVVSAAVIRRASEQDGDEQEQLL